MILRSKEDEQQVMSDNLEYCLTKANELAFPNPQNESNFVIVDKKVEKVDYNFFQGNEPSDETVKSEIA